MTISVKRAVLGILGAMVLLSLALLVMGFPGNLIFGLWGISLVFLVIFGVIYVANLLFSKVKKQKTKKQVKRAPAEVKVNRSFR